MSDKFDTSWFKLENYAGLEDLDLLGWFELLSARYFASGSLEHFSNTESFIRTCKAIKQNPIIKDPFFSLDGDSLVWQDNPAMSKLSTYSVRSTAFIDISCAILSDDPLNRLARHALACVDDGEIEETKEQYEMAWMPVDFFAPAPKDVATVTIDLTVSDKMIMDDFEKWLKGYRDFMGAEQIKKTNRKQEKPIMRFSSNEIKSWVGNKYLPYLDLNLIAKTEGKSISKGEIAKLIFTGGDTRNEQNLRPDTYDYMADFLIKPEVLDFMRTQATQYSDEYKNRKPTKKKQHKK